MFLRKVERRLWDWREEDIPWLPPNEFPAAPLGDLRTSADSKLSVWHIEEDRSNLALVVAAVAASRDHADKFDYVLFSEDILREVGIHAEVTRGTSRDSATNEQWHRDLTELTASKLVVLARLIGRYGTTDRFMENEVELLIREAIAAGRIDPGKLDPKLRERLFGRT